MDWITLLVEAVGVAIFVVWAVVPAREFRDIYRRLKEKPEVSLDQPDKPESAEAAIPVTASDGGNGEGLQ